MACNLNALNDTEQGRRAVLFEEFRQAVQDVRELSNGCEVTLDPSSPIGTHIDELLSLERQCCSFLNFDVTQGADGMQVVITGKTGIKAFLIAEFGFEF